MRKEDESSDPGLWKDDQVRTKDDDQVSEEDDST